MARRVSKNGPLPSSTLLKGAECLWLGFHKDISDYSTRPITYHFFQGRALKGCIGVIRQAGLYGVEIDLPSSGDTISRLNLSVEEVLPMTTQESNILKESISTKGEITMTTQKIKIKRPKKVATKIGTYMCEEKECSFSSSSPQGLGTHRVKSHNLESRSQKRSGGRKIPILANTSPTLAVTTAKIVSTESTINAGWKSKHDAIAKRYNRLFIKHESVIKTLKKLVDSY